MYVNIFISLCIVWFRTFESGCLLICGLYLKRNKKVIYFFIFARFVPEFLNNTGKQKNMFRKVVKRRIHIIISRGTRYIRCLCHLVLTDLNLALRSYLCFAWFYINEFYIGSIPVPIMNGCSHRRYEEPRLGSYYGALYLVRIFLVHNTI